MTGLSAAEVRAIIREELAAVFADVFVDRNAGPGHPEGGAS